MIKLAVCGDSWFCSDLQWPGRSFGEIMAEKNSWELISLARGGCSNVAIALQIDQAIAMSADMVVIATTTPDRIEIPILAKNQGMWASLKSNFNWDGFAEKQLTVYNKSRGLANIKYHPHPDLSSKHDFLVNPCIISESMNNIAFFGPNSQMYRNDLTADQYQSLQSYMLYLYDSNLKRQIDAWIISAACHRLVNAKIPFLVFIESLFTTDLKQDINWIPKENIVEPEEFNYRIMPMGPSRFHYCPNTGGSIFADYIQSRLIQLNKKL
jgi:hypothetical protein